MQITVWMINVMHCCWEKAWFAVLFAPSTMLWQTKTIPGFVMEWNKITREGEFWSCSKLFSTNEKINKGSINFIGILFDYELYLQKVVKWFHEHSFGIMLNAAVLNGFIKHNEFQTMGHSIIYFL